MRRMIFSVISVIFLTSIAIAPATLAQDTPDIPESVILQHENGVNGAQWNADSTRVLTWDRSGIYIWDSFTGELLETVAEDNYHHVSWNGDESGVLATNGTSVSLFGDHPFTITNEADENWYIYRFFWNDDYSQFATINVDGTASVYTGDTGELLFNMQADPDSSRIPAINWVEWVDTDHILAFSGSQNLAQVFAQGRSPRTSSQYAANQIALWDVNTEGWLYTQSVAGEVQRITWNPSHSQLLINSGNVNEQWNVLAGELIRSFDETYSHVSWLDDNRIILTHFYELPPTNPRYNSPPPPDQPDFTIISARSGEALSSYTSSAFETYRAITVPMSNYGILLHFNGITGSVSILDESLNRIAVGIGSYDLRFSHYGPHYAVTINNTLFVIDARTGYVLNYVPAFTNIRYSPIFEWSPDGSRFLQVNHEENQVIISPIDSSNLDIGYTHYEEISFVDGWTYTGFQSPYVEQSAASYIHTSIAWDSDSSYFYGWGRCARAGCLYVFDVENHEVVYQSNAPLPYSEGRLSPDGSHLFLWTPPTSDMNVFIFNLNTETLAGEQEFLEFEINDAIWSPDGSTIALIDYSDYLHLWRNNEITASFELNGRFEDVQWVDDALYLVESNRPGITVTDVLANEVLLTRDDSNVLGWRGHTSELILYGTNTIELVNLTTGETRQLITEQNTDFVITSLALSDDGSLLVYATDEAVYRIEFEDGTTNRYEVSDSFGGISISPNNQYVATYADAILNLETGEIRSIDLYGNFYWSPSSTHIATLGAEEVIVTEVATGEQFTIPLSLYPIYEIAWSSDGTQLLLRDDLGVFIWNVAD